MKKYILISIVLLLCLMAFTPIDKSKVPIKNIQGLQDSLNSKPDTSEVNLIINNINPHDSVWFKDETYHKDTIDSKLSIKASTVFVNASSSGTFLRDLQAFDATVAALPIGMITFNYASSAAIFVTTRIYYVSFRIEETVTTPSVGFMTTVAGSVTSNNYNGVAIYRVTPSTGAMAIVGQTASSVAAYNNTAGKQSMAFETPIVLTRGVYTAMIFINGTGTMPTVGSYSGTTPSSYPGLSYLIGGYRVAALSAPPSTDSLVNLPAASTYVLAFWLNK